MMTKKKMWLSTGLYVFCALIWTVNFFLHWKQDGAVDFSTALFGVSAVLFAVAAVMGVVRLTRLPKENVQTQEEK